jgi:hypothetical protein
MAWHPGQQHVPQSLVHREPVEGGGIEVAGGAVVKGLGADVVAGAVAVVAAGADVVAGAAEVVAAGDVEGAGVEETMGAGRAALKISTVERTGL